MLREDQTRSHQTTIGEARRWITDPADLDKFDEAVVSYIKAKTRFSTHNSDETMINLIGAWARSTRIINQMDDKYGIRR